MTVAELIESLKALPQDMKIQVLDSDQEGPVDIIQVSRGTWSNEVESEDLDEDEDIEDYRDDEEPEFVQDDASGKIAVLVTW